MAKRMTRRRADRKPEQAMKAHRAILSLAVLAGIFFVFFFNVPSAPALPVAETILLNGKIYTVDDNFKAVQALAIADGKILALGSNDEIHKLAVPSTRIIDLGGRTVIPGLADNHLHSAGGGPGVDLSGARTMQELLDAIGARVKQAKPGE